MQSIVLISQQKFGLVCVLIDDERRNQISIEFFTGAIFDKGDTLSRQAFEYAVAKINAQSQIFTRSKIIVTQIDLVDAHDSFFAYKLGINS